MKQKLQVGDIIEVKAKDRSYSSTDYKIKITEITSCMSRGREIEKDGTLSIFGMNHRFKLNYDDKDNIAHIYGNDTFNCWDRKVIPSSKEKYTHRTIL